MLKPSFEKEIMTESMLDLMVAFYNAAYSEMYKFRKPADEILQDSITIRVKMNQFGRCRIGSEVFGSAMSVRHTKSSYVLAKFINSDGKSTVIPDKFNSFFPTRLTYRMEKWNIIWHTFVGIDQLVRAKFDIIFILMMKMRAVTSSCGNPNFMMKAAIVLFLYIISFVDLYHQNIEFLLGVMLLNIWRLIQLIANSKFVNN
jgi:hypothetical protein